MKLLELQNEREVECPLCGEIHFIGKTTWKNFFSYGEINGFWQLSIFYLKYLFLFWFLTQVIARTLINVIIEKNICNL